MAHPRWLHRRPRLLGATLVAAFSILTAVPAQPVRAAPSRVLLKTGDTAGDGTVLSALVNPAALGPDSLVFLGATEALLHSDGDGQFDAIAKTGDPLPPPLTGTFNDFSDPAINDAGTIVFPAGLNSPDAPGAVYLFADGTLLLIDVGEFRRRPAISDTGNIAYASGNEIRLWTPARGSMVIVDGQKIRRLLAVNSVATVVFEVGRSLYAWRSSAGVVTIAARKAPSPIPGAHYDRLVTDRAFVLDDDDRVTFCARVRFDSRPRDGGSRKRLFATFVHDLASATTTVLDESEVCRFAEDARSGLLTGDTPIGRYVTTGDRAVNEQGAVAAAARRQGLYLLGNDGAPEPVVRPEDSRPGGGPLLEILAHTVKGGTLLVLAVDERGPVLLSKRAGGRLRTVVASGDPAPSGCVFDLEPLLLDYPDALSDVVDAFADDVVFASYIAAADGTDCELSTEIGIFRANTRTGRVRVIAQEYGTISRGVITRLLSFVTVRRRTVFSAIVDTDGGCGAAAPCQGIFMDGGRRPRAIALAGERASGGLVFARFGALAAAAGRVAFGAFLADPDESSDGDPPQPDSLAEPRGIFTASRDGVRRVAISGRPTPQVGAGSLSPDPTALVASGHTVLFAANVVRGQETGVGLFSGRGDRLTLVAGEGGDTQDTPMIQGVELHQESPVEGAGAALGTGGVIFLASTVPSEGTAAQQTLFLRRHGRLIPLASTGEQTPLGGTFGGIGLVRATRGLVVYRAELSGASARAALFAVDP